MVSSQHPSPPSSAPHSQIEQSLGLEARVAWRGVAWRAASREVKRYLYGRRLGEELKKEKESKESDVL